jgi:hypothetical protein
MGIKTYRGAWRRKSGFRAAFGVIRNILHHIEKKCKRRATKLTTNTQEISLFVVNFLNALALTEH